MTDLGRILGVLLNPTATFRSLRERPAWALAMAILVVTIVVYTWVMVSKLPPGGLLAAMEEKLADDGVTMSSAQLDQLEDVTTYMMVVGAGVGVTVALLLRALLAWLLMRLVGADFSFKVSLGTTTYASAPMIVHGVLVALVSSFRETITLQEIKSQKILTSNLAAFAPDDTGIVTLTILGQIEVFALWSLVLTILGYAVVGKVSRSKAALVIVPLWAVGVLVGALFASMGS